MLFQNSIGININDEGLSIVYLQSSFSGIQLAGHAAHKFDSRISFDQKLEASKEVVRDFIDQNEVASSDIFIGIPRDKVIIRELTFPDAVKENLRKTVRYELEKYVPIPVDQLYFDSQIVQENKITNEISVLLIVIKKNDFDPIVRFVSDLGAGVSGVEIESTAIVNYFSHQYEKTDHSEYAVLDCKKNIGELLILKDGFLKASKMVHFDQSDDDGMMVEGISQELESLSHNKINLSKLFVCGELPDNVKALSAIDTIKDIEFFNAGEAGLPNEKFLSAFGLAVKGLKKVSMQVNLLPERLRKRPSKTGYYLSFALICLVVILGTVWAGSRFMNKRHMEEDQRTEISRLTSEVERVEKIKGASETLGQRIDLLNNLVTKRVSVLNVLNELASIIPITCWIDNFVFQSNNIQIEGTAETASILVPAIEASHLFYDAAFLSTISKDKDGRDKFKIGMKVN